MPAFTYLGDGSSNPSNVPAADITDEDWAEFDDLQKESIIRHSAAAPEGVAEALHLYEEVIVAPPEGARR